MVDEKITKRNPKAFIYRSTVRAKKGHARRLDVKTKKHHLPVVSKEQELPPPMVVAIVGPPKSGKSTVLSSLIKHYTKSPVSQITGPITVVAGKRRRLTFIECPNDINSMVDLSKVVDLALLIISAKDGLQMEIFEFLSMIQVTGFPKVMGVLTFLDQFKENKTLKVYKKKIKDRFWSDVYPGAKVFYLTGFKYSSYGKREVINLARFISLAKTPQLSWRMGHPYLICDRIEDITDPEEIRRSENNCDRKVALYGYVQGTHLKSSAKIHIMGVGDYSMNKINFLPDPCPFPDHSKNRRLDFKEKLVYAPFSSINNILFDKDAVYIDVGQSQMFQLDDNEFKHLPVEQRVLYEGYRPGMYVRIEIGAIENEFITNFDAKYPLIIGGLIAGEDQLGYLNFRIKKHKWYQRILKNNDPVIVSLGWRRFQTIASYSMEDHNKRKRYVKYTPAHIHCYATCFGPLTLPGVGMFTLQVPPYIRKREFHLTATGVTIEVDQSLSIVKKLKLIGTPYKIFKNTAFIK
ncbi:ribosome biogenesis protein BMS1 homolog, partial [Pempheris klunzingeri]|uniref:ribosome biogenesis protein BMS1 homolog n=1 Tax=Pempheris klunzingeri TaxID=3127111 RepID=UPI003980667D